MRLVTVDPENRFHSHALFDMLAERTPEQSISHKRMPSFADHLAFLHSEPYARWYLIVENIAGPIVGNVYLTYQSEIGLHIATPARGKGYGTKALRMFRELHPGPLFANVNPANQPSIDFFTRHGGRLIQHTYEL